VRDHPDSGEPCQAGVALSTTSLAVVYAVLVETGLTAPNSTKLWSEWGVCDTIWASAGSALKEGGGCGVADPKVEELERRVRELEREVKALRYVLEQIKPNEVERTLKRF